MARKIPPDVSDGARAMVRWKRAQQRQRDVAARAQMQVRSSVPAPVVPPHASQDMRIGAADGYAACLFEHVGYIDCHPYIEDDGRVYLEIGVESEEVDAVVLRWLETTFQGHVAAANRAERRGARWEAVGQRASALLQRWIPYMVSPDERGTAIDAWRQFITALRRPS